MGQGGGIKVHNRTLFDWFRGDCHVSGMNWTLPSAISAGSNTLTYVEFVSQPYAAQTQYKFTSKDGQEHTFRIVVDGSSDYNIWILNESVPSNTLAVMQTKGVPWRHDGEVVIELFDDPFVAGHYNFIVV